MLDITSASKVFKAGYRKIILSKCNVGTSKKLLLVACMTIFHDI